MSVPRTLQWIGDVDGFLRLLDQTQLPARLEYRDCRTAEDVWEAIRALCVRGAPATGLAAAYGMVLGLQTTGGSGEPFHARVRAVADYLRTSRPTAVNLFWALARMEKCLTGLRADPQNLLRCLLEEAAVMEEEDRQQCRALGRHGASLVLDGTGVLTHCNAGGLATADYGTALGVLYTAAEQGRRFAVYADETRPLLQGARLTAWELQQRGLDVTLLCDSMAAQVMKEGRIQLVLVGADRIAANGDTANKIGTYSLAVLARAHRIPFYVAAPFNTFDLSLPTGKEIPIEQRDPREVTEGFGVPTAPAGIKVHNPAFDVTPAYLISGFITEHGIFQPVNPATVRAFLTRFASHAEKATPAG